MFVVMQAYAVLLDACILKQFCRWLSFGAVLKGSWCLQFMQVELALGRLEGLFGKAGLKACLVRQA